MVIPKFDHMSYWVKGVIRYKWLSQGTHSNCIFKFPVFSLSNHKFSLCQFTQFATIIDTKLTWQTYPASGKKVEFSQQISQYHLPLGSGNLQLEQTQFPVFWQDFQIHCVFPDRDFFGPFFLFSLCRGYPVKYTNVRIATPDRSKSRKNIMEGFSNFYSESLYDI